MRSVFVHTDAWTALVVADDPRHPAARRCFEDLTRRRAQLLTTNYVLSDVTTELRRRCGLVVGLRFLVSTEEARASRRLNVVWADPGLHEDTWRLLQAQRMLPLSFVDACSAIAARRGRASEVLTFDRAFESMGFELPLADA